jgi:hypothetical protein
MAFGHVKPYVYRAAIEHMATEEYRTNQIDPDTGSREAAKRAKGDGQQARLSR